MESLNQNGWLAVTSQESGHKGSVTVYDNSYSPLVRFSLSNRFVMDAARCPGQQIGGSAHHRPYGR